MPKYTLSTWEYAQLSEAIYEQKKPLEVKGGKEPTLILDNGTKFFVHLKSAPDSSDYQGALLEKATKDGKPTGEFITVSRGSKGETDWVGNFQAMRDGKHPQEQPTKDFAFVAMHRAQDIAKKNGTDYSMTNTGHSLGGYDSHIAHLVNRGKVVAFNALNPSVSHEWNNNLHKTNHNMIENHIIITDYASAAHKNKMPGTVHTYARKEDFKILNDSGYGNTKQNQPIGLVLRDMREAGLSSTFSISHSHDNFAGVNSVLKDPQAKVRANEWKKLGDEWRSEVPANREAIINKINSVIQNYQKYNPMNLLGEIDLNQGINDAVHVASAGNFVPKMPEPTLSPTSQRVIQQCNEKFTDLCEKRRVTAPEQELENVKAAAAYVALNVGMTKIDKMDFGENRTLFMLSHEPHAKLASLSTDEAVNIPVSQSMANIHAMEQQNAQQVQERQMAQSQQQNHVLKIG